METKPNNQSYESAQAGLEKATRIFSPVKLSSIIAIIAVLAAAIALVVPQAIASAQEQAARQEAAKARIQTITKTIKAGDTVRLGTYPQYTASGSPDIEWRVLAVEDGKALLISEYGLDAMAFNSAASKGNDWETSELKKWLESDFKNTAFTKDESALISGDPFCLSALEAAIYFPHNRDRICFATPYAKTRGVWADDWGSCLWWLRSAGSDERVVAHVYADGEIDADGHCVDYNCFAVRPAIWVNL